MSLIMTRNNRLLGTDFVLLGTFFFFYYKSQISSVSRLHAFWGTVSSIEKRFPGLIPSFMIILHAIVIYIYGYILYYLSTWKTLMGITNNQAFKNISFHSVTGWSVLLRSMGLLAWSLFRRNSYSNRGHNCHSCTERFFDRRGIHTSKYTHWLCCSWGFMTMYDALQTYQSYNFWMH